MQHPMLTIAVRAARKAANLIIKYYEIPNIAKTTKNNHSFVTNVNKTAETLIIETIRKSYPQHAILTKENSAQVTNIDQNVYWVINSLDGADNFNKRLPHFSVSIAACIKNRTEVAVVYDPMRNEMFVATRGQGAQLNGYRLRSSTARDLDGTILATGFPSEGKQHITTYMNMLSKLFIECADFRHAGSSALNLAYLAAGRVDGCFEIALKPWNFMAGELIAREAGALVCDFTGGHNYIITGNLVAGNPRVVRAILANIRC